MESLARVCELPTSLDTDLWATFQVLRSLKYGRFVNLTTRQTKIWDIRLKHGGRSIQIRIILHGDPIIIPFVLCPELVVCSHMCKFYCYWLRLCPLHSVFYCIQFARDCAKNDRVTS